MKRSIAEMQPEEEISSSSNACSSLNTDAKRSKPSFPTISPPRHTSSKGDEVEEEDRQEEAEDSLQIAAQSNFNKAPPSPVTIPHQGPPTPYYNHICHAALSNALDHHLLHFQEYGQAKLQHIEHQIQVLHAKLRSSSSTITITTINDTFFDELFSPSVTQLENFLRVSTMEHKIFFYLPLGYHLEKYMEIAGELKQKYRLGVRVWGSESIQRCKEEVRFYTFLTHLLRLILYVHLHHMYEMFYQDVWKRVMTCLREQRDRHRYHHTANILLHQLSCLHHIESLLTSFQQILINMERLIDMLELTRRKHLNLPLQQASSNIAKTAVAASGLASTQHMQSSDQDEVSQSWLENRRREQLQSSDTLFASFIHDIPSVLADVNNNIYCAYERMTQVFSIISASAASSAISTTGKVCASSSSSSHVHTHYATTFTASSSSSSMMPFTSINIGSQLHRLLNPIRMPSKLYLFHIRDLFAWNHQIVLEMKIALHRGMNLSYLSTYSDYHQQLTSTNTSPEQLQACKQAIEHVENAEVYFTPAIGERIIHQHLHQLYHVLAKSILPPLFLPQAIHYAELALRIRKSSSMIEQSYHGKIMRRLLIQRRKLSMFYIQCSKCEYLLYAVKQDLIEEIDDYLTFDAPDGMSSDYSIHPRYAAFLFRFFRDASHISVYLQSFDHWIQTIVKCATQANEASLTMRSKDNSCLINYDYGSNGNSSYDGRVGLSMQDYEDGLVKCQEFLSHLKTFCDVLYSASYINQDYYLVNNFMSTEHFNQYYQVVLYAQELLMLQSQMLQQTTLFQKVAKELMLLRTLPRLRMRSVSRSVAETFLFYRSSSFHYGSIDGKQSTIAEKEWLTQKQRLLQLVCDKYLSVTRLGVRYHAASFHHLCLKSLTFHELTRPAVKDETGDKKEEESDSILSKSIANMNIMKRMMEDCLHALDLANQFHFLNEDEFRRFDRAFLLFLEVTERLLSTAYRPKAIAVLSQASSDFQDAFQLLNLRVEELTMQSENSHDSIGGENVGDGGDTAESVSVMPSLSSVGNNQTNGNKGVFDKETYLRLFEKKAIFVQDLEAICNSSDKSETMLFEKEQEQKGGEDFAAVPLQAAEEPSST